MVVNPDKFQSLPINTHGKLKNPFKFQIDNHEIDSENSTTLLGIEIDNKLNLKNITALYQHYIRKLAASKMLFHVYISKLDFRK